MDIYTFLLAWFFSVLAMTGFSAFLSHFLKMELREHLLLSQLVFTLKHNYEKHKPKIWVGWILHYAMGLFFLLLYELLWVVTGLERTFFWSSIFGIGMGVVGVIGWMAMFKLHPNPPELHFRTFYIQLIFAHVVFSWVALLIYSFGI